MAKKKLGSIVWPNLPDDVYFLDADKVEYGSGTVSDALKENSANIAGMANGSAVSVNEDSVPYIKRTSGGGVRIGGLEEDTLVGASVGWNQLCNGSSVTVQSGHKYYLLKGGVASVDSSSGSAITGLTSGTDMVIDLTQMFGSTIADYIYSLEQATAGAGVAFFKSLGFDADYYEYDEGSIKSVEGVSAHVMRDANENVIGNYAIDDSVILRGLFKLNGDKVYADGDIYPPSGEVSRRYGIVNLGALDYNKYDVAQGTLFRAVITGIKQEPDSLNLMCPLYTTVGVSSRANGTISKTTGEAVDIINNAYSDAATFKTAMSGVYLVYELATPTTETATAFASPQAVDKNGTEEYITSGIVPIGHETKYPLTVYDITPTADGLYTLKVTVTDGEPTFEWVSE